MQLYSILLWLLIMLVDAQHRLYQSDRHQNCFDIEVHADLGAIETSGYLLDDPYQIIRYCIDRIPIKGAIASNLTFFQLKELNVSVDDLLSWYAPVDLIEDYELFQTNSSAILSTQIFNNCSILWFGDCCQYSFASNETFEVIVSNVFLAKKEKESSFWSWLSLWIFLTDTGNSTCFVHLECQRGPKPLCLDWREICDGHIDCLNDGVDEKNCFELERNQCNDDEYRCHNGMCIPAELFGDHPWSFDCLDGSDENNGAYKYIHRLTNFGGCYRDPTFQCEESDKYIVHRGFVCGDGQQLASFVPGPEQMITEAHMSSHCSNLRDMSWIKFALDDSEMFVNLTSSCEVLLRALMAGRSGLESLEKFCTFEELTCYISFETHCPSSEYIVIPFVPHMQNYVVFGYWTNKTIVSKFGLEVPRPHFACYDVKRCLLLFPVWNLGDRTCIDFPDMSTHAFIDLFHKCIFYEELGNQTDCFYPSLFHCPNTSKCISRHRLVDGFSDCPDGSDEKYSSSCELNDPFRFECAREKKCLSPTMVRNGVSDCPDEEDEVYSDMNPPPFQDFCDGFVEFPHMINAEENETDETDCEAWPCVNLYTKCDRAWTCPNGADEVECDPADKCYPKGHRCISPIDFEVFCLPINRTGDGKVDCLGSTDERRHCRENYRVESFSRYRCWNSSECVHTSCEYAGLFCPYEKNQSLKDKCDQNQQINAILSNVWGDMMIGASHLLPITRYFTLTHISLYEKEESNSSNESENILLKRSPLNKITSDEAWFCHRGIRVFVGLNGEKRCFCPPSYYGDRCQFQNERVSLTLQLTKSCMKFCDGVYWLVVTLMDQLDYIYSYDRFTYVTTHQCRRKFNIYLLYRSRPKDSARNYTIRIDAYKRFDLSYYASWRLSVRFLFLPVQRITARLIIPEKSISTENSCPLECDPHSDCLRYVNVDEYFCRCHSGWSGVSCSIRLNDLSCSSDSLNLGQVANHPICLCPIRKNGPRCLLPSTCTRNPCINGGVCIPDDDRTAIDNFTCICQQGFSGDRCQFKSVSFFISFEGTSIPQMVSSIFVSVPEEANPYWLIMTKKIPFDRDSIAFDVSVAFNMLFIEANDQYYLAFLQANRGKVVDASLKAKSFDHCPSVKDLFDHRTMQYSLVKRAKHYHRLCLKNPQLKCLHDREGFICLCGQDGYANCFNFNGNQTSECGDQFTCENNGRCFQDDSLCPRLLLCICPKCFFGGRCQFTTKVFSLSLEIILGYQIQNNLPMAQQPRVVKVSAALSMIVFGIGLINALCSIMTFQSKNLVAVGCRFYLLTLSYNALISTVVFTVKFWWMFVLQTHLIQNQTSQTMNCVFIDFLLRCLAAIGDWISTCLAIERILVIAKGVHFDQKQSFFIARWVVVAVLLLVTMTFLHEPINRRLVYDDEERRSWCTSDYSPMIKMFDYVMHIFHFFVPLLINLLSAAVIIVFIYRNQASVHRQTSNKRSLMRHFAQHKHLILSPLILTLFSIPRLVIAFLTGCMESSHEIWIFLFGYFIAFTPSLMTTLVFIWPSAIYKKELISLLRKNTVSIVRYFSSADA